MGAGHGHRLHYHGHSWLHRAPAQVKVLGLLAFVLAVVSLPREWYAAHGVALVVLGGVIASSRVPPSYLLKRLVIEIPFVLFAALMPFLAAGERVAVMGLELSRPGLVAAWALLAKGTLGVLASLTLAATTEPDQILAGLTRLRVPALLVSIMGFMIRYLDVVSAELSRMGIALRSRGYDPRSPRQWPVLGRALGALFIRAYERGERVHLAMLSRGYTGVLPALDRPGREH